MNLRNILVGVVSVMVCLKIPMLFAMGDSASQQAALKEPAYADLEEDADVFNAQIYDGPVTEVTKFSFFGHTAVGGIRRENDDSVTKIDLTHTKLIKVVDKAYVSKRYPDKDFAMIEKVALDGTVTTGLLMPRHIVICGVEKGSEDEKAWFLCTIDKVDIEKAPVQEPPAPTAEKAGEKKNEINEIKNKKPKKQIVVNEQYKEMEIKVVEKKADEQGPTTIMQSINDLISAIIGVVKAVFNFITSLFW